MPGATRVRLRDVSRKSVNLRNHNRTPTLVEAYRRHTRYTGGIRRRTTNREPRTAEIVEAETNGAHPEPGSTR